MIFYAILVHIQNTADISCIMMFIATFIYPYLMGKINKKSGGITKERLLQSAEKYGKSPYGIHLKNVAGEVFKF